MAVSVIAPTTSLAEVWSRTLFLKGPPDIDEFANPHSFPASWIDESGNISSNGAFDERTIWVVDQAPVRTSE